MKKIVSSLLVLGLSFSGLAVLAAQCVDCCYKEEKGILNISTSTQKEVDPDIADLTIIIKSTDKKNFQEAIEENRTISEKVIPAIKALIKPEKGDYIKTTNYSASPDYVYNKDGKASIKGYTVTNNIVIRTTQLDKLGIMIDKALDLGATSVDNLSVSISDYSGVCKELMSLASKSAYAQATSVTSNSGSAITGIKTMNVSCTGNRTIVPRQTSVKSNMISEISAEYESTKSVTIIEHGALRVNANLNAVYFVK